MSPDLKREPLKYHAMCRWLEQVACDPELPGGAVKAAIIISQRINKETGVAHIGTAKIAETLGVYKSGVEEAVAALVVGGHLGKKPGGRGRGKAAYYWPIPKTEQKTSNGHGDPAEAELRQRARELLGECADKLITRLLHSYDGDIEDALDTIACAADEHSPRGYIEEIIRSREVDD